MKFLRKLCALGALALPSIVSAASPNQTLHVHVPFAFIVAGQEFAAGDYQVVQADNGVVLVQGNGKAAAAISTPSGLLRPGAPSGLRFSPSGQRQYLVGVQIQGESSRSIPTHGESLKKLAVAAQQ
jgi:hypothetical protein